MSAAWSLERAERHLLSLELFGMRFGLDRMRRLETALGSPQRRFDAVHVVGTNGKSSTVRMTAAILEAQGIATGAYLSPHLTTFAERIRIGDSDLPDAAFAAAIEHAAAAAAKVDRTAVADDHVTQFELLTGAAFWAFAEHGVQVAVVEAGLGGRHDATAALESRVQVLTNVGLEHTRWLGPTIADIAREKLAVVPAGGKLVVGELDPVADAEAVATAERQGARLLRAPVPPAGPAGALPPLLGFQRTNFAVARTAAEALLGELDEERVRGAAATVEVPGRLQRVAERPLTVYDGAHNPSGVAALAAALPDAVAGRPLVAVVAVLDDKDAAGMLRALLPLCRAAVFTGTSNPRALPPATLASLAGQLGGAAGGGPLEVEPDPRRAVTRARELAGPEGAVVATGSIYLVADLLSAPGRRRVSAL